MRFFNVVMLSVSLLTSCYAAKQKNMPNDEILQTILKEEDGIQRTVTDMHDYEEYDKEICDHAEQAPVSWLEVNARAIGVAFLMRCIALKRFLQSMFARV